MKTTICALAAMLFSFTTIDQKPIDRIGVKGPLKFNQTSFKLSWTAQPNDNYYVQEYVPVGETVESFNQMLTIHLFVTDLDAKEAVAQKVMELTERKKIDAVCNYQVTESPDGQEFVVDFLVGESEDDKMTIVEFNVHRYKQIEISKNEKALVIYSYSKRSYGADITEFFKTLKSDRASCLNQMTVAEIPAMSIGSK
jgi:hypothetical protein